MNILISFLFKITIIELISVSLENKINPLPEGNGKLNDEYSHQDQDNLFFAFLNCRHGVRTPLYLIDNHRDMLGGKWLKDSMLTELGKKQHYEIGVKTKKRYSNFISNEYDPKELLIYSTHKERAIMSAQSQLLGLYNNINFLNYNNSDIQINNKEKINSIMPPINLFLYNEKNNIKNLKFEKTFRNRYDCLYLKEQVKKNRNKTNEIVKSIVDNFNEEYYDILKNEFKSIKRKKIKTIKGFDRFCDAYTAIYFSKDNKHILNKFIKYGKNTTRILEICNHFLHKYFIHIKYGGYASNNSIISISPIIKRILDWMEKRIKKNNNINSDYSSPKFIIFSGHDSTLFEMQYFLNKSFDIKDEYTTFASTQTFELRKYNDMFYVEIYYNDKLKLNITYNQFKQRVKEIAMDDRDIYNICYRKKEELYIINLKKILISLNIILIVIFCFLICRVLKQKKVGLNYQKII